MSDLEQRLRAYARTADQVVRPVSIGDLGNHAADHRSRPGRVGDRWVRGAGVAAVAACVVVAVAVGFVVGRVSAPEVVVEQPVPAATTVDERLVTLPEPSPADPMGQAMQTSMETAIGTISWRRVDGDSTTLPRRVTGREGDTLIGEGADPTVRWTSNDGGATWERTVLDGVRRTVAGHEWIWRPSDDGHGLARVTPEAELPVDLDPGFSVSAGWRPWSHVALDGLPVELDGTAFVLSTSGVSLDLREVADAREASTIEVVDGPSAMTWLFGDERSGGARNTPSLRLFVSEREGASNVDLVDEAGQVVVTVDTRIDGHPDLERIDVIGGARSSRWSAFDGEAFVPIDVPWSSSDVVDAVRVGDAVLVIAYPGGQSGRLDSPTLWRTTDGRSWEHLDVPVGDDGENVTTNVVVSGDAVVVEVFGDNIRRYLTEDGRTFQELSAVPDTADRRRSDIGWVALDHRFSSPLWVSDDGHEWGSIAISALHDLGNVWAPPTDVTLHLDGPTIYLVVTNERHSGDRTLLIGDVTPHP